MKKYILVFLGLISMSLYAGEKEMNTYLFKIVQEIDAISPLIKMAEKESPKNSRIKFHFSKYTNGKGKNVNGLKDDLQEIKKSILEHIEKPRTSPRKIDEMNFDFIGDKGNE